MNDTRKAYDFKGTVTISVEEYRDLIEDAASAKHSAEEQISKRWDAERNVSCLEERVCAMNAELETLRAFVEAKKDTSLAFKLFCAGIDAEIDDA